MTLDLLTTEAEDLATDLPIQVQEIHAQADQVFLQEKDTNVREVIQVPSPANQDDRIIVFQEKEQKTLLRKNLKEKKQKPYSESAENSARINCCNFNSYFFHIRVPEKSPDVLF